MKKNNLLAWLLAILILVGSMGAVFLIRLAQAEFIYHDKRCVFAECRIQK